MTKWLLISLLLLSACSKQTVTPIEMTVITKERDTSSMGCFGDPSYRITLLSKEGYAWTGCGNFPVGTVVKGWWVEGPEGLGGEMPGFHFTR